MDRSRPLVSIGVPIYNEQQFLAEALDSLLAQDYGNIEIIISDNASTDGTQEICLAYASRDERISYHREDENKGATYNFNRVFHLSGGQYFTWAGGHDTRDPTYIRRCVEVLEQRSDVVLCYPRSLLTEYAGSTVEMLNDTLQTAGLSTSERLWMTIQRLSICNAIYGVIRSSALQRCRPFRRCLGSDHVLLAELSVQGAFQQIADPLFFRRENRPTELEEASVSRILLTLGAQDTRGSQRPYSVMGWEHLRGVWHASNTPLSKVLLTLKTARWFWRRWRVFLLNEWFPRVTKARRGTNKG